MRIDVICMQLLATGVYKRWYLNKGYAVIDFDPARRRSFSRRDAIVRT
jgi:hypothetical protein